MILQALAIALAMNSQTTCTLDVTVRQAGRYITRIQVAGFATKKQLVQLNSNEPLTFIVSSRDCTMKPYVIESGPVDRSALTVDLSDKSYLAAARLR